MLVAQTPKVHVVRPCCFYRSSYCELYIVFTLSVHMHTQMNILFLYTCYFVCYVVEEKKNVLFYIIVNYIHTVCACLHLHLLNIICSMDTHDVLNVWYSTLCLKKEEVKIPSKQSTNHQVWSPFADWICWYCCLIYLRKTYIVIVSIRTELHFTLLTL